MDHKSFLKDGVAVFGTQLFILIVGFVTGIILARLLGPEGKGILSSLLVYPTIMISLLSLGVRQSAVYYIGSKKYSDSDIIGVTSLLLIVSSLIGVLSAAILFSYISNPNFDIILILFAVFIIPADLAINYYTGILIGKKQITKFNQIMSLNPVINFLLIIFLVYFSGLYVKGAVLATLIGKIVISGYSVYLVNRKFSLSVCYVPDLTKKMVSMGAIYAFSLFILNLNYQVDIIILERLSNATEIGQYTIGVGLSQLLWQLPSALGIVIFSYSSNAKDASNFSQIIARMVRMVFPIVLVAAVFLYYISDYIIPLLYGSEFIPSIGVLKILLPGIILMSLFKMLNMDLAGKGKPEIAIAVFLPAVIINIVLNIILIPDYGGRGAAIASTISYSIGSLLFVLIYARINQLSLSDIFIYKKDDFNFIFKAILKFRQRH